MHAYTFGNSTVYFMFCVLQLVHTCRLMTLFWLQAIVDWVVANIINMITQNWSVCVVVHVNCLYVFI